MNKTLKWILIGLAIAVGIFIIATPIFLLAARGGISGDFARGMMPGFRMPFHRGFEMMPFGGIFGGIARLFGSLIVLAIIGLAVWGIVALARGNRMRTIPPTSTPAQPPAASRNCVNCGKPLTAEGDYCPYCGTKQ